MRIGHGIGIGYSAGVPFLPPALSNLKLWLRADAITGKSDGETITTWNDESGQANDVTQATASKRPIYKTGILNGQPVLRFDGADDILGNTSYPDPGSEVTIFIVGAIRGAGDDSQGLCEIHPGSNWDGFHVYISAGNVIFRTRDTSDASQPQIGTGGDLRDDVFRIFTGYAVAADAVYIAVDSGTPSQSLGTFVENTNTQTDITVGGVRVAGWSLEGDMAEFIVYHSLLSAVDRQQVETYLSNKYGISI